MSVARRILGGCGTTAAGLVFAGLDSSNITTATEEFTGGGPATFTVGTD